MLLRGHTVPYGFLLGSALTAACFWPARLLLLCLYIFLFLRRPVPVLFIPGIKYAVHVRRPKMRVALSFFSRILCFIVCAAAAAAADSLPLFAGGRIFARNFNDRPMRQVFLRAGLLQVRANTHARRLFHQKDWNISGERERQKTSAVCAADFSPGANVNMLCVVQKFRAKRR
jgi:hypothetical protein